MFITTSHSFRMETFFLLAGFLRGFTFLLAARLYSWQEQFVPEAIVARRPDASGAAHFGRAIEEAMRQEAYRNWNNKRGGAFLI